MTITPESVGQLLNSEDLGDRLSGLNKVRELDRSTAFGLVKPLVEDRHPRIRYAAVSQIATLGEENLAESLELLRDRLFNDSEVDVRAAAADALGGLKITEAFEDLEQAYNQTSDWLLQFSIIAALGEMGDRRCFDLLEKALASENSLVQLTAISALGELNDDRAVPLIIPFATDSDWQVRYRVAQALGRLGGDEAQAILAKLAGDEIEQVSEEAKNYLASNK